MRYQRYDVSNKEDAAQRRPVYLAEMGVLRRVVMSSGEDGRADPDLGAHVKPCLLCLDCPCADQVRTPSCC